MNDIIRHVPTIRGNPLLHLQQKVRSQDDNYSLCCKAERKSYKSFTFRHRCFKMDLFRKKPTLDETIFQLRFTGKQIDKMAAKAEKEQKKELNKVKKELSLGKERYEFAQLYAENAIRKKNECLNYMRLSSRLDGVASRLKTAQSMKQVTKDMGAVTNGLDQAMKSMDLEKVAKIMDKFESQFENLDVHASVMENSMGSAMASTTPQDQVQSLIQQVADENGLEISNQLDATPVGSHTLESERAAPSEEEELERRLRAMRGAAQ